MRLRMLEKELTQCYQYDMKGDDEFKGLANVLGLEKPLYEMEKRLQEISQ